MVSFETRRLGVEYTIGSSIWFCSMRSDTSRFTREHSIDWLDVCMVVRERDVFFPLVLSFLRRSSVQNDVFEPESRNAYVSTFLLLPFTLTFTGTIDNPITELLVT